MSWRGATSFSYAIVFGKLGVLRLRDVHLGTRFCAVNCVGFEARGHGKEAIAERPATVLNPVMSVTQTGGRIGIFRVSM